MATDLSGAVHAYLVADSTISAAEYPVREDELHQGDSVPAIVFWRVSGSHVDTINGSLGELAEARVTIEAYGTTRAQANTLAEVVRLAMVDFRGTRSGVQIRNCVVDEAQQHYTDRPTDGNSILRYIAAQDFRITFVEDV